MEKVKFINLYTDVLKKHTTADAENHFILGAPMTTPDIEKTPPELPKPWLFARVLALSVVAFFAFYAGAFIFKNALFLPGLILFGSVITPLSLLMFFWEINILQNISIYKLTLLMLKGSIVSLLCAVTLYAILDGRKSPLLIGFVEETAKVLTILLLVDHRPYKFLLNGMLIGAAVGTGFAAFESSGYILVTALQSGIPTMLNTIFWRALFTPGGHIAWAALTGAMFILVKGERTFNMKMLLDSRFLGMYALVIVLHALWDTESIQLVAYNIPVVPVALTVVSWVILFAMMKIGFRQVFRVVKGGEGTGEPGNP
ncbi:PrsW family intramembrane metalloprotease [Sporobacter termitidis]|nr:PrsW family glutamic-type intramembrane protease [Sporobacter termitidis]